MESAAVKTAKIAEPSERRSALMKGAQADQRQALRFFVTAATKVKSSPDGREHVGLVRDLSGNGLFVYSDFEPEYGTRIEVILRTSKMRPRYVCIACRGTVVRVEPRSTGTAIGIAVAVDEYEFCIQNTLLQLTAGQPSDHEAA